MSLQAQLNSFLAFFRARVPCERADLLDRGAKELCTRGIAASALNVGDAAPDFQLPAAFGAEVGLSELLDKGPVVLMFFRGGWCPYCSITLRAYQAALHDIHALGAHLIAISPQTEAASRDTAEKNGLDFPLLVDAGARVAQLFGIAYVLPEGMRRCFTDLGHALPDVNGGDDWRLPIPATYVIAPDPTTGGGRIRLAHVDADYRHRLEPADAIAELRRLRVMQPT